MGSFSCDPNRGHGLPLQFGLLLLRSRSRPLVNRLRAAITKGRPKPFSLGTHFVLIYSSHACNTRLAPAEPGYLEWPVDNVSVTAFLRPGERDVLCVQCRAPGKQRWCDSPASCLLPFERHAQLRWKHQGRSREQAGQELDAVGKSSTGCFPGAESHIMTSALNLVWSSGLELFSSEDALVSPTTVCQQSH